MPLDVACAGRRRRHRRPARRIDVLVDNAGRTQVGAIEETTGDELRALFDLHVFGPFALTRAVLPQMRERGSGAIVMMSSVGGQVVMPGFGVYCGTKFALEGVAEALAAGVQATAALSDRLNGLLGSPSRTDRASGGRCSGGLATC